nr:retrovirus-related Pol polyprotein from transposon TNT 1-94 [Tanacetum cinerariifolium]
ELLHGRTPSIGFMRPFGYPVTILNTLDPLGKFQRKVDEGFIVGYSVCSKAFRVFNSRTLIIQETLHVNFLKNKPNVAEKAGEEVDQQYVLFLVWSSGSINPQNYDGDDAFDGKEHDFDAKTLESEVILSTVNPTHGKSSFIDASQLFDDPDMPELEDITYSDDENDVGAEADFKNLETSIIVSPILTTRIHKDHPEESKRVHQALKDPSWIEAMQEELLQFKMQKVWVLVDLPHGKRAIVVSSRRTSSEYPFSRRTQSKKQDDKTKKEAEGKSHVESFTGY